MKQHDYYKKVSEKLDNYLTIKKMTNGILQSLCVKQGFEISETTIQRIRCFHTGTVAVNTISIYHIYSICSVLEINQSVLLDCRTDEVDDDNASDFFNDTSFINLEETNFKAYFGEYFAYFYPTKSTEHDLLKGKLILKKNGFGRCEAIFTIYTKGIINGEKRAIEKKYFGHMKISRNMNTCYIYLKNDEIGEISCISFRYMFINKNNLACRIALALTSSAGDNKIPTVHRILFSRTEVSEEKLELLKGQLLMNNDRVTILKTKLQEIVNKSMLTDKDKDYFLKARYDEYYVFYESLIKEIDIPDKIKNELLCKIRVASISPKNSKVSGKADDIVYNILSDDTDTQINTEA